VTIPDLRYVDQDLREDPELQRRAESYALHYKGDFDFLTRAQGAMQIHGNLPIGVARGVLNCMRIDPAHAPTLPPPTRGPSERTYEPYSKRRLHVVEPQPKIVWSFKAIKNWKMPYFISMHHTAQTVHSVDKEFSGHQYIYVDDKLESTRLQFRGLCCTKYSKYRLLSYADAETLTQEGNYRWCPRCRGKL
jgi:hypothetical protein